MNATLSVQELWSQIRMLPAGERHWLANKLYDYEEVYEEEEERLTGRTERTHRPVAGRCKGGKDIHK